MQNIAYANHSIFYPETKFLSSELKIDNLSSSIDDIIIFNRNEKKIYGRNNRFSSPSIELMAGLEEPFEYSFSISRTVNSTTLFIYRLTEELSIESAFISVGKLKSLNSQYNFFNDDYIIFGNFDKSLKIYYYILGQRKETLIKEGSYADYPVACQDPTLKPTTLWFTDLVLFADLKLYGFPTIGTVDESFRVSFNNKYKEHIPIDFGDHCYIQLPHFFNKKIYLRINYV